MFYKNIIILLFCLLFLVFALYFYLKFRSLPQEETQEKADGIDELVAYIKLYFNDLTGARNDNQRLDKNTQRQREEEKNILQKAIRSCSHGDYRAKEIVKRHIKNWLVNGKKLEEGQIEELLPFSMPGKMKASDKFEILLYSYSKEYGFDAAKELLSDLLEAHEGLNSNDKTGNVITSEDVEAVYEDFMPFLDYDDKLNLITNFIYRKYKGHGVIDSLRDQNIDGISAGVSGIVENDALKPLQVKEEWDKMPGVDEGNKNYESVWVFYKGNMVRLAFLSFESQAELERVCKNVYRYNSPGQLSAAKGYIANEMKDGSRVVVVRPPFSESWAFFIRKFGSHGLMHVDQLITGPGSENVILLLKHIIEGCQVFAITGEQGCGKTTLLKALIEFIPPSLTLRIQELVFELHLRNEYPDRNIVSFRETDQVSGRDGLDLQKKTDGTVNIIGEVASADVAGWLIMVSQVASRFSIFTHHAKTTESLIMAMRNDLMLSAGFNNEEIAELQVRQSIRFDVHMVRLPDGSRKIQRITEICRDKTGESTRPLVKLMGDKYVVLNRISKETENEMLLMMDENEQRAFLADEERFALGWIGGSNEQELPA